MSGQGREGTGLVIVRHSGFVLSNNEPQGGQRAAGIGLDKEREGERERGTEGEAERKRERGMRERRGRGREEGREGRRYLICETTE